MRIGRSLRLRLPWQLQNPAMRIGLLAAAFGLLLVPSTAQGPPGAVAAAAGAAAAATFAAPAPAPRKTASSAATNAAAMGNSGLAPENANDAIPAAGSGETEVAANSPPPVVPAAEVEAVEKIAASPLPKDVATQCANLLKMATLLKAEVAKTNKDTLSIAVVRDAGHIEDMAKKMRAAQH